MATAKKKTASSSGNTGLAARVSKLEKAVEHLHEAVHLLSNGVNTEEQAVAVREAVRKGVGK
jgi:hypothetical protein